MSYEDFDVDKARELREKAKESFVKQSRKSLIGTLLASLPLMALVCFAGMQWGRAPEPESRMFYSGLMLLGIVVNAGLWAVHALDARLLLVLKEAKQLRLDFLSSQEAPFARATGGAESLSTWTAEALQPRVLALVVAALCVLGGGLAFFADKMTHSYPEAFGGQEVVEAHVTPEGTFRVCSRISITKCADNVASIPLHLPQPGATLESVTIGGRRIPFEPIPDKEDTYAVMPGMPEMALKNAVLEVVWSPQAADIRIKGDRRHFNLQLQGMVPITAYTANAVIDDGAPYQFAYPDMSSVRSLNLYWTLRQGEDYREESMGCCTIAIETMASSQ